MGRILGIGAACMLLAACVGQRIEEGTKALVGQPLDAAIAKLGVPTAETVIADRKVYTWSTRNLVEGSEDKCQIRAIMNGNVIGSFDFDGNYSGCLRYAVALKPS
jgi:hypothetical protein